MKGTATLRLMVAICLPLTLAGCKTVDTAFDNDCKVGGTAIGAVVGGVAGGLLFGKGQGRIGTALIGAAAGAFVGNQLGALLDCQDQKAVDQAGQKAAEAPVGEKVVWASSTAQVPVEATVPLPVPAAVPAPMPEAKPQSATSAGRKTAAKAPGPAPMPEARRSEPSPKPKPKPGQWAAVEPVRSAGNSGMWGWVEPVSEPTLTADGRTCRDIRQVAVDQAGARHTETLTSCRGTDNRWAVVASAS